MKLFDTSNMGQKVDILRCKNIEKLDAFKRFKMLKYQNLKICMS